MEYSVVIPTYNREKTLALALESVSRQTLDPARYEILVIDDGSTDNTRGIVREFQQSYPWNLLRYFYQENAGPAAARNRGIREARGEIIFFTDDDCVVPTNWLETLLDGYRRHPEVVGVGGWYRLTSANRRRYFQRYIEFLEGQNNDLDATEIKTNIFGYSLAGNTANMSYQKSILEEVGSFDEQLYFPGAVDWELKKNIQRRGYYLLYVPFMVEHLKDFNLKTFSKRFFDQGRGFRYMTLKYPELLGNASYNISFFNFLKRSILYLLQQERFFFAFFLSNMARLAGKYHVSYLKFFPELRKVTLSVVSAFELHRRKVRSGKLYQTKFHVFESSKGGDFLSQNAGIYLSVVIPTYNRSSSLLKTLQSVVRQTIAPSRYEIIVIDDGSTDDTRTVIRDFQQNYHRLRLRCFYQENAGPAKARNRGIREARGEIIFFTDDDCVVPSNWLETLCDGYRRYPEVAGVGGWLLTSAPIVAHNALERYIRYLHFYTHHLPPAVLFHYEIVSDDPLMGIGVFANNTANLSVRRAALERIGGFREEFFWPGSEDTDLTLRILYAGLPMLYLPFHVTHLKNITLGGFYRLYFRREANHYLFRKINRDLLEEISPGLSLDNSFFKCVHRLLYSPQRLLTLLWFVSVRAGVAYAKREFNC